MDKWQNETKIGGMLQHNYENQRNKVMFVFNCKKRLEISTFVYFANTFALKTVSSTQGIRCSWNPNSKACFISTHLQSRPTLTWFEVGPAQSMHWFLRVCTDCIVESNLPGFLWFREVSKLGYCAAGSFHPWVCSQIQAGRELLTNSHKLRPTSPFDALSSGLWQERRANFTLVCCG